jgi:hypothetical protein
MAEMGQARLLYPTGVMSAITPIALKVICGQTYVQGQQPTSRAPLTKYSATFQNRRRSASLRQIRRRTWR